MNSRRSFRLRRAFFARQTNEEFEKQYNQLMEQQFQLKYHGRFTLFEQSQMVAEDRTWYLKRLEKEFKDKAEREKKSVGSIPRPRRR